MKPSPTYRAILELERRSSAALWAVHSTAIRLARDRDRLVARNAAARKSLLNSSRWSSFDCQSLVAHTAWTATIAATLAAARRRELDRGASLAEQRLHWARCRRGLERRAESAVMSRPYPWRA